MLGFGRRAPSGAAGESLACRYLEKRGLAILARNYRCRVGEIDVVARDRDVIVFVEVKERRGASHGAGYDGVTSGKRQRVVRAAQRYAQDHGLSEAAIRFDVVSIDWLDGEPQVRHDRGAFDSEGN
jgi:putative endonuclease